MEQNKESAGDNVINEDKVVWALFFEKLLQNVDAEVMVSNNSGNVVFANKRYFDFFGFGEDSIIDTSWVDNIIHERDRDDVTEAFKKMKEDNKLCVFDTASITSDGNKKHVCSIGVPLRKNKDSFYMFFMRECNVDSNGKFSIHESTQKTLSSAYDSVVEAIFEASRISEPGTAEHALRVMNLSVSVGKKIGLTEERLEKLRIAALLHDLGKLAIDEQILFKKGKLTEEEFEEIKRHPYWGAEVIKLICFLEDIIPIMVSHHENCDGSGYPRGLSGEQIPVEARILSIADVYEALTADRPYRKGFSYEDAIRIIKLEIGHKFDPELMKVFLDMLSDGEIEGEGF